jgi:hypothetical protein
MMTTLSSLIRKIFNVSHQDANQQLDTKIPKNLIRLCKRKDEFLSIISDALMYQDELWQEELINRVIHYVFEDKDSSISVFSSEILDPFDFGHALGVIAEGISQREFRSDTRKRKSSCTRGSLIIPITCIPKSTVYDFTPRNNLNFYPANNYHFDLTINDTKELAIFLLNGIRQGSVSWTILGNEGKLKGSYHFQAIIAYSYCLSKFGKLDTETPPLDWMDGKDLSATEQIDTLKHLAQTKLFDRPTSIN